MKGGTIIVSTGLAGVGKTTHLKLLASIFGPLSVYINKDDINAELGQTYDPESEVYKRIAPKSYDLAAERALQAGLDGKIAILDGYFGNKLTNPTCKSLLDNSRIDVRVIYFHCSGEQQKSRLLSRASPRDKDKEGDKFAPYRQQHLQDHLRELAQVPHLFIDTELDESLEINVAEILKYLHMPELVPCFNRVECAIEHDVVWYGAEQFKPILDGHIKQVRTPHNSQKKLVILDAGGVLHADSHLGAANQIELQELSGLSPEDLNGLQDHESLSSGKNSFRSLCEKIQAASSKLPKPFIEDLIEAYKRGIALYPSAVELISDLYSGGYQVVILTNNSDVGVAHTKRLMEEAGFPDLPVYGSAPLKLSKPNPDIFLHVCKQERVDPSECWFIDDRKENCLVASGLSISSIHFSRGEMVQESIMALNYCRERLKEWKLIHSSDVRFPLDLDRGKYPGLFGLRNGHVVKYIPVDESRTIRDERGFKTITDEDFVVVDSSNEDGNQRKRCLYESQLAQLIVEGGREFWEPAYLKINMLFLLDFDYKADEAHGDKFKAYFEQVERVLKKENILSDKDTNHAVGELRATLVELFKPGFNLTNVSQFYYGVWLLSYGSDPLELFVFYVDVLKTKQQSVDTPLAEQTLLSQRFGDLAHSKDHRQSAYLVAQPWVTCGQPQLRGRQGRLNAPKPPFSSTIGIIRDGDAFAGSLFSAPHFAAKTAFSPVRTHPVARMLEAQTGPIIGGSSGTLGRNLYMLAPLVEAGLLTSAELHQYVMGFVGDLIYRGHHSFEEVATVAEQVLKSFAPWFDPLRDSIPYYEQLLTQEFLASDAYGLFRVQHEEFFDVPLADFKM